MEKFTVKQFPNLMTFVVLLFFNTSCEKVINFELPESKSLLVIEGEICDNSENHTVRISKTHTFRDTSAFDGVSGALVEIISSSGQLIRFQSSGKGIYKSSRVRGFPGTIYTLKVQLEGKTYLAKSTIPPVVRADSITFKRLSFPGSDKVYPAINYKDLVGFQNNYRFLLRINALPVASMVTDDKFNNGNNIADLIYYEGANLKVGDKIEIDLLGIDRNVFKYFFALSQINGNSGPPVTPDNPISNIDNGAFGIFSAQTKSSLQATIR